MQAALALRNVVKSFGSLDIIQGANLDVSLHEKHAIIGPNGAGKSTLFNLISGRLPVSSGNILLNGRLISGHSPEHINWLGLGRSFQISNIFPRMTVFENIRVGVMAHQRLRHKVLFLASRLRDINEKADRLAGAVGLERRKDTFAGALSYSEQRALEIAVTLATDPSVLLLDEPTAGMSSDETAQMVELIRKVCADRTLLVIEHDMRVVFGLCDRISVLVYGNFLATGTPEEIRSNLEVQRAYLGEHDL